MQQHPKDFINKGNIGGHYDDEDLVEIGVQFLQEQSLLQLHCRDKQRGKSQKPRQVGQSMTGETLAPQGNPAKPTAGSPPYASI